MKKYIKLDKNTKKVPKEHIVNNRKGLKQKKTRSKEEVIDEGNWRKLKRILGIQDPVDDAIAAANEQPKETFNLDEMLKKSDWSKDDSNMWS